MKIASISQWSDTALEDAQKILEQSKKESFDKFIIFGQAEFEIQVAPGFNLLLEAAQLQNKKLIAISGAHKVFYNLPYQDKVDYEFSPTFFFTLSFGWLYALPECMPVYTKQYNQTVFKYPMVTFNNRAHPHRSEMIDLAYKNNLFEGNLITWHHEDYDRFNSLSIPDHATNMKKAPYYFKYWSPTKLAIDDGYATSTNNYSLISDYWSSFAQLISESTEHALFITEKTTVPLLVKKPFLVATACGYHKFLQELGFQLYDEIFDYSFDSIENRTERYEALLQNFVRLKNQNLTYLHHMIQDKLEYNRCRAVEIATKHLFASPTYLQTIELHKQNIVVDEYINFISKNLLEQSINNYRNIHGISL